ncbi:ATP-grasp fold amidoligase family protein [Winogradskyella thalassocola]|uniref:TupA-like ATPgrasp n=1 Tax=Winogradskyella thalassocola TaxID=262004 RepID=A0A1G8DKD1_9FLAO|nr:ATP-grasp fold amidoligase family protein [Winogradskyella thalassocola]SDH57919.1 TupA-like ATPgrasp [Winogradskyella thalassocola]
MKNLKEKVAQIYRTSDFGYNAARPIYLLYQFVLKYMSDEYIIKKQFKERMGYELNLKDPQTLNEKINWLKLYNHKDLQTIVADKYKVRAYVEKKVGAKYLIPLLLHTKDANDLRPENLPDSNFIIKANHNSSGGLIVRDKSSVDWKAARKRFRRHLKENYFYSSREWQYKNIEPCIIAEELLTYEDGSIPEDYKFHCFNGKLAFVMIDFDRHTNKRTRNLYDTDWNLIPCNWGRPYGKDLEKPENFEEMKMVVEKLAQDFIYVRVDLYLVKGSIYFGEITFHHNSGHQRFIQEEWDYKFGQLLKIQELE